METKPPRKPYMKHPRVLRRNVVEALKELELWAVYLAIPGTTMELLEKYRANRPLGISSPRIKDIIHPQLLPHLEKLEDAFKAIHDYSPEDYFSEGTYIDAMRRSGGHKNEEYGKAKQMLMDKGYLDAPRGVKKTIKEDIGKLCSQCPRTLDDIIKELKVERKNK